MLYHMLQIFYSKLENKEGQVIANRATLSGAEEECQTKCGVVTAMASAALVWM